MSSLVVLDKEGKFQVEIITVAQLPLFTFKVVKKTYVNADRIRFRPYLLVTDVRTQFYRQAFSKMKIVLIYKVQRTSYLWSAILGPILFNAFVVFFDKMEF